jgi:hypothetical protein
VGRQATRTALGHQMASWARVAGACAQATRGLLRQEAQLGRAAQQAGQQSRGFAAGEWWEAADTAEGAGGERGGLAAAGGGRVGACPSRLLLPCPPLLQAAMVSTRA